MAFLRDHPMQGSFYEAVWASLKRLLFDSAPGLPGFLMLLLVLGGLFYWIHLRLNQQRPMRP